MKKGKGKAKGSSFERQIAKALSLWITQGEDATQLIRSVLSGGWTRGQTAGSEGWRHVGDLAPNGPLGEKFRLKFAIECKHRKSINLYGLWTHGVDSESVTGWWNKLIRDAAAANVSPMLIFRSNCMPTMVALHWTPALATALVGQLHRRVEVQWMGLVILPFDELLKCSPESFLLP